MDLVAWFIPLVIGKGCANLCGLSMLVQSSSHLARGNKLRIVLGACHWREDRSPAVRVQERM